MRASVRIFSCSVLGAVVGLSSPVARAGDGERAYQELSARTKLDLGGLWKEYQRRGETRPFEQYVESKYRHKRDVGRGLVFGGAGLGVVAVAMFFLALPRNDSAPVTYTSYAFMGVAGGMMITGGVLWRKNFQRIERLEPVGYALGPRGRVRLQSASPLTLPRGGGVSFGLAF